MIIKRNELDGLCESARKRGYDDELSNLLRRRCFTRDSYWRREQSGAVDCLFLNGIGGPLQADLPGYAGTLLFSLPAEEAPKFEQVVQREINYQRACTDFSSTFYLPTVESTVSGSGLERALASLTMAGLGSITIGLLSPFALAFTSATGITDLDLEQLDRFSRTWSLGCFSIGCAATLLGIFGSDYVERKEREKAHLIFERDYLPHPTEKSTTPFDAEILYKILC